MKLRNTIFVNGFIPALNVLIGEKISMDKGFALRKLAKGINEKAKIYEEARSALIDRYAKKDEDGNQLAAKDSEGNDIAGQIQLEDAEGYNEDYLELVNLEEDYDFEKLEFSKEEAKKVNLTVNEVGLLEDLLEIK